MATFGFAINKALVTEVSPNAEAPKGPTGVGDMAMIFAMEHNTYVR